MKLHSLKAPKPNLKTPKRVGRGEGSGLGQQSGRGHKGQKSRSGYSYKSGFEGGQMPLQRRVPKFGFHSPFRTEYKAVNLDTIQVLMEEGKLSADIKISDFNKVGLVGKKDLVKVLGRGELSAAVTIEAHGFSKSATEAIEKAGGSTVKVGQNIGVKAVKSGAADSSTKTES
ncbi:MAG: 50S ribosomal protein L15 [Candidatus Cyclonatronum sp.]|uniref:50S ribosomal protein L15 n=1 Tax=Cyclonatronum sp. TaxID=3024185 RepID=UPI0025BF328B|nr:50S ribosomal protein L15 [Cyclonatronum sp.]MCC5935009.1 50S ribosomal protein L15 [Balneolales bacterium]MCH8487445.1 50S ribosomal protein L15 [Cyclonatronum sp.]